MARTAGKVVAALWFATPMLAAGAEYERVVSRARMTSQPCRTAVEDLIAEPDFIHYYVATGRSLPVDAGRYASCRSHKDARYFLVGMEAHLPSSPHAQGIPIKMGFCLPSICDHEGVKDLVNSSTLQKLIPALYNANVTLADVRPVSADLDFKAPDTGFLAACVALGSLALVAVVSSAIMLSMRGQNEARAPGEMLLQINAVPQPVSQSSSFSSPGGLRNTMLQFGQRLASSTIVKAFTLVGSTGTLGKLVEPAIYKPTDCLNGARVLSMAGIILGHTYVMPMTISGYASPEDSMDTPLNVDMASQSADSQIILGAQTSIDTFFFLTGFLLTHLTMKEIRAGKFSLSSAHEHVLFAVVLRYLRLAPSLALVMLAYYKICAFIGEGPFAVQLQQSINSGCDGSWWSELTYTMNFTPSGSDKVCMSWSWYLGDDMIFFIITLIILPIYARRAWAGWLIVTVLTMCSFALTSYYMLQYNLGIYTFGPSYKDYSYLVYSKPYSRIPAYFVGIVTAWILEKMEKSGITRESRPHTPRANMMASLAALVATAVILFIIFIPSTAFGKHANEWSSTASAAYVTLSRPVFAAGWAVITLLCYYDYVPLLNGFLSHRCWTPLARLTYGAYLVHPLIIKLSAGTAHRFYTLSSTALMARSAANALLAILGSIILWALCERPCMTIFCRAGNHRKQRTKFDQGGSAVKSLS